MKNNNLTKTLETCKRILALEEFNLYMNEFCSDSLKPKEEHTCGTSYCIAGWLAHLDDYPSEYFDGNGKFDYGGYSDPLVQYNFASWDFLFNSKWPNSLEHAKKRAQYIIDHDSVPDGWEGNSSYDYKWGM